MTQALLRATLAMIGSILMLASHIANAGTVTIDFDDVALTTSVRGNFESNGFRFSPCSSYGIANNRTFLGGFQPDHTRYQGFNNTQFFHFISDGFNPDWLGPSGECATSLPGYLRNSMMYIDNYEHPFSLESIYGPLGVYGFSVYSSKGFCGSLLGLGLAAPEIFEFSGSACTGVQWVKIFIAGDYDQTVAFDHITFRTGVPEPGTLAILALGFAGLGLSRRKVA